MNRFDVFNSFNQTLDIYHGPNECVRELNASSHRKKKIIHTNINTDLPRQTLINEHAQKDPDQDLKNAPNPIQHQKEKTNNAKPQSSTTPLLHHIRHAPSLLPHLRPRHILQAKHNNIISVEKAQPQP
jgi:hypothetical protein